MVLNILVANVVAKVQWPFSCSLRQVHGQVWCCGDPSQIESNRVKSSQIESNCEEYIISIFQFLRVCLESNSEYSLAPFTEAIVTSGPGLTNMVTPMQAHPYACLELFRYV